MDNIFRDSSLNTNAETRGVDEFFDEKEKQLKNGTLSEREFSELTGDMPNSFSGGIMNDIAKDQKEFAQFETFARRAEQLKNKMAEFKQAEKARSYSATLNLEESIKRMTPEQFRKFEEYVNS
jgi:hypothetical protein